MIWKRFQRVVWALLAVCVGGMLLLFPVSSMGFILVAGSVDSVKVTCVLPLVFLLTLMVWGDGAIVRFTRGWERGVLLTLVLTAEVLILLTVLFFTAFFNPRSEYIPLYNPGGEVGLVIREESWLFSVWGEFCLPAGPCLLQRTGVTYAAHDICPFSDSRGYELDWTQEKVVVRYNTGAGDWGTCTVPLS